MEVPLGGDDQWDALEEALNTEGLRALYVASDCPFLDNSINDAKYKMTQPEQRDVCHTWPAHGGDLCRIQIFNPTSMCAYVTASTRFLWLGFELSLIHI